ncbi:MAG: DUF6054 family protein [Promethearchaeota archaeon]
MEKESYLIENVAYNQLIHDFERIFPPNFKFSNKQDTTTVLIIEKYYFRINSNLTITLIFNKNNNHSVGVHIITSGGKEGLFGLTWGSEKSALNKIIKFFEKYDSLRWRI